jgi:hypothetical protein
MVSRLLAVGLVGNLHTTPGSVAHAGGPVAWPYLVLPLVLLGLTVIATVTFWVVLKLPVRRELRRAPMWATDIPDVNAAIRAVEAAEACLHAHDPLMSRALARLACARSFSHAGSGDRRASAG